MHFHIPHLPMHDPFHRQHIDRAMQSGGAQGRRGPQSHRSGLSGTEVRLAVSAGIGAVAVVLYLLLLA